MQRNYSTNQKPGNGGYSVEHNQKLIRQGEAHNQFTHQIYARANQRAFVCIYMEIPRPVRGQKTSEIQWSAVRS